MWMEGLVSKNEVQVYSKGGTAVNLKAKVVIVPYDLAWKMKDMVDHFKVAIADEAHYLKNSTSKRAQELIPFLSTRKRVLLLSGTPALARPR